MRNRFLRSIKLVRTNLRIYELQVHYSSKMYLKILTNGEIGTDFGAIVASHHTLQTYNGRPLCIGFDFVILFQIFHKYLNFHSLG